MSLHVVGIVGVPAAYGGFETLVEHLIDSDSLSRRGICVYSERASCEQVGGRYKSASLVPLRWKANGWQSTLYDLSGMVRGARTGADVLVLGTSATIALPLLRLLFPRTRFFVNMAGLEWMRGKWGLPARTLLKVNEWAAARFADALIADNEALVSYVRRRYGVHAVYIPYGGDQFEGVEADAAVFAEWDIPTSGFDLAIARAQVDNNIEMILEAYAERGDPLVFVSNWDSSDYGRQVRSKYAGRGNLHLVGPIYDAGRLKALRSAARVYVHGHSAGGTNPSLVEAMWARLPVFAYDVPFNRCTTEGRARFFASAADLCNLLAGYDDAWAQEARSALFAVAQRKYSWQAVRAAYEQLLLGNGREAA